MESLPVTAASPRPGNPFSYTGQIGDGTCGNKASPASIPEVMGVRDLTLGDRHTCALLGDGGVSC
jgi:hypothetical protein